MEAPTLLYPLVQPKENKRKGVTKGVSAWPRLPKIHAFIHHSYPPQFLEWSGRR